MQSGSSWFASIALAATCSAAHALLLVRNFKCAFLPEPISIPLIGRYLLNLVDVAGIDKQLLDLLLAAHDHLGRIWSQAFGVFRVLNIAKRFFPGFRLGP